MKNMYLFNVDCNMDLRALTCIQGLDFAYKHTYKMKRKWNLIFNLLKPICI